LDSNESQLDMKRKCLNCGSANVRRSGFVLSEAGNHSFRSPYRCRECDARFWVVSKKTYVAAIAGGTALALTVLVWAGDRAFEHLHVASVQSTTPAVVVIPAVSQSATSRQPFSMEDAAVGQALKEARRLSEPLIAR
jgi:hypothetical protein